MPSRTTLRRIVVLVTLALVVAACDGAVVPSEPPATAPAQIEAVAWAGAICQAADQLSLAVGDPSTGQRSGAWNELETALAGGDADEVDNAANAVLGHLGQGATAAIEALGFEPGAGAAMQWLELLEGLTGGVRRLEDGTRERNPALINEGRAEIDAVIEEHFEQALGQTQAVPLAGVTLPCV